MLMRLFYNDVRLGLTTGDWPLTCMNELLVPQRRAKVGPAGNRACQRPHCSDIAYFLGI